MADIRIEKNKYPDSEDTIIEVIGVDTKEDDILGLIHGLLGEKKEYAPSDGKEVVEFSREDGYMMRTQRERRISISDIKKAISGGYLDELLKPYDEINIECLNDREITIVCAYSSPTFARFIFKECWDEGGMIKRGCSGYRGGYYKSQGRGHILERIYPQIPKDWRDIITPRKLVEQLDEGRVEYIDPLWIPSATDVGGIRGKGYGDFWKDSNDSFRLPIFEGKQERIKKFEGEECSYWLRTVATDYSDHFCLMNHEGTIISWSADHLLGFAPGFDIGRWE